MNVTKISYTSITTSQKIKKMIFIIRFINVI